MTPLISSAEKNYSSDRKVGVQPYFKMIHK